MIVIGININTIDTTNRNNMIKNIPPGIQLKKAFQRKALLKNRFLKFNEKNITNNKNVINKTKSNTMKKNIQAYDRQLYIAVLRGNMKSVMQAIKHGADVNQEDDQGRKLIINAIVQPSSKCTPLILRVLIDNGCDLETKDLESKEPLLIAIVRRNKYEHAKIILEHPNCKPDSINIKDIKGRTPLMWAAYKKYERLSQYLISKNANMKDIDYNNSNAFLWSGRHRTNAEFLWKDEYDGPKNILEY